jgi:hypothetical protein
MPHGRQAGSAFAAGVAIGMITILIGLGTGVAWAGEVDASPTATGPVTGGKGQPNLLSVPLDPANVGYRVEEYLIAGDASAYEPEGTLGADGEWSVNASSSAPYKTRVVVWKPAKAKDFNGTVFVEWLNVTGGFDAPFDWVTAHNHVISEGAAWVGVSAQAIGVQGGTAVADVPGAPPPGGLKGADPERYGSLTHPGDGYSYDIFSQAAMVVRGDSKGTKPFAGYDVQRVIGMGQSQSAGRLTTYVNAVQPLAQLYDGLLIHSRGGGAASLAVAGSGPSPNAPDLPDDVKIRSDLDVPVLTLETETDLTQLGFTRARQADSKQFRLWEIAGTSHIDGYPHLVVTDEPEVTVLDPAQATGGPVSCDAPINAGVQQPVAVAALAGLERWVRTGTPPRKATRLQTSSAAGRVTIERDANGIAKGGVRTPIVDVPLAANTGEPNSGGPTIGSLNFCSLFGTSTALDASALARLYPNGADDYVARFARSADEAAKLGFWLKRDAARYKTAAEQMQVFG